MSNGTDIAAEIDAALREAAEATGDGPFIATLEKPGARTGPPSKPVYGEPTTYDVPVLDDVVKLKDGNGSLTGETMRVISLSATVIRPNKGDRIRIRGDWFEIEEVMPLAPGGVDLMYEITLVS